MKINKKLLALMMTFVIGGTVLTGCGQKTAATPETEQSTTTDSAEEQTTEEEVTEEQTEDQAEVVEGEESFTEEDPTVAKETIFIITDGIEGPASMDMPEDMFADSYGIDTSLLESYCVQMPLMNVHANEVAVFEVKDEANIDAVKAGIEKRQAALEAQWSSYLPEQYELVKASQVAVKGNLVLYVVSSFADQIVEKFNA